MLLVANALQIPVHNYSAKLVYCDPPTNRGMNEGTFYDHLRSDDYFNFCFAWLREAIRCMSANSWLVICLYHRIRYIFERILRDFPVGEIRYDHEVIWEYDFGLYTHNRFVPSHDNILIFKQGKPRFDWQSVAVISQRLRVGDPRADLRGRTPGSVWRIPRVPGNSKHRHYMQDIYRRSCQPVELCTRFVESLTQRDDLVLDLFAGSGSMGMACKIGQRRYVGMDLCEHYMQEAKNRLENEANRILMEDL